MSKELEQRLRLVESQLSEARESINFLLSHTSPDNSPDRQIQHIENELNVTQILLSRFLLKLIETGVVKDSDLKTVFESLETDFPYPKDNQAPSDTNTAIRYLFKTVFSQMPNQQTAQFAKHYK